MKRREVPTETTLVDDAEFLQQTPSADVCVPSVRPVNVQQTGVGSGDTQFARLLRTIRQVGGLSGNQRERSSLIAGACKTLVDWGAFGHAWIGLVERAGRQLICTTVVTAGWIDDTDPAPLRDMLQRRELPECALRALCTGACREVDGPFEGCEACPAIAECADKGVMVVSLVSGENVYGVLGVTKQSALATSEERRELLSEASAGVSVVLHNLALEEQRDNALQALAQSERRYRALFENAAEGISVVDIDENRFLHVNPALCALLGYTEEELHQLGACDIYPRDQLRNIARLFEEQGHGKISVAEHVPCLRKDRGIVYANISNSPMMLDGRRCNVGFFTDSTESKRAREALQESHEQLQTTTAELIQTEKLTALGELAAGVAHELNQPLNAIRMIVQTIQRNDDAPSPENLQEDLEEIQDMVDAMAQIIDHMRTFVRQSDEPAKKPVNVNALVIDVLRFLGKQLSYHNIELSVALDPTEPTIMGHHNRLQQVLLNLLINARNSLDGCKRDQRQISVRTLHRPPLPQGSTARAIVEVEDTGSGIPKHLQSRIFEPFFTTRDPGRGTGLGLSIAARIIKDHDGRVCLESDVDRGTLFRLEFPAAPDDGDLEELERE